MRSSERDIEMAERIKRVAERLDWGEALEWDASIAFDEYHSTLQGRECQERKRDTAQGKETGVELPKTTTRIIKTLLTRSELLSYARDQWRKHRVQNWKLSPLRNETVVEDISEDEWEDEEEEEEQDAGDFLCEL